MTDVLIVEDTPSLALIYEGLLSESGRQVATATTIAEARAAFARLGPPVVLLDLMLPDGCGLEFLRETMRRRPETRVIVITANGSVSRAVAAMRAGAFDFRLKPANDARLASVVTNALNAAGAGGGAPAEADVTGLGGTSAPIRAVRGAIGRVAGSTATVFVTGESGTGKEVCARAIHDASPRAGGPFVAVNCAAIPGDLLESEMFGHRRGAFTGAVADQTGAAAQADGGTLFLDEICEMDRALQAKLLRFIETGLVQPLGAGQPRKVEARIIAASNRDPLAAVRAGDFREDLYYRLYVVPLEMPPLRERGEDVIEIAEAELGRMAAEEGRAFRALSEAAKDAFRAHDWPGNVRELLNLLRRIVVLNDGEKVTAAMLPEAMRAGRDGGAGCTDAAGGAPAGVDDLAGLPLEEVERRVIEAAITRAGGSVPQAARALGLAPSTLYRKRARWVRSVAAAE